MTQYKVTYTFEASSPEAAAQKVFASFYIAGIEANDVTVEQSGGGEVFSYPLTQSLIRTLNEGPVEEGDWQAKPSDRVGEDVD